jgi:release factor glutamine methyltransferase
MFPVQMSTPVYLRASIGELRQLWTSRLEDRVPFQYLVATAHWRDLVLMVQPGVLIPRPETELLVSTGPLSGLSLPSFL